MRRHIRNLANRQCGPRRGAACVVHRSRVQRPPRLQIPRVQSSEPQSPIWAEGALLLLGAAVLVLAAIGAWTVGKWCWGFWG